MQRRERNRIQRLKDSFGEWKEGQKEVTKVVLNYFQNIYATAGSRDMWDCLVVIPKCVSDEENHQLCKQVSDEEIRNAVFSLRTIKAPGGDGLNALFFQKHWIDVGLEVCLAMKAFFSEGFIPDEVNETQVVLIAKYPRPEQVSDFHPISCCNFFI